MEKNEKRVIISYLHMKGQSVQKIYLDMKEVLYNDAPLQATVYRWTAALQRVEHCCGHPSDVYTEENVDSVQDTILKDRRRTINLMSVSSYHIEQHILFLMVWLQQSSGCRVPRMSTAEITYIRVQTWHTGFAYHL